MSFLKALRALAKSKKDCVIGGVCGGLGEHTPIPAWIWRAAFLTAMLLGGFGAPCYVILWIALPEQTPSSPENRK